MQTNIQIMKRGVGMHQGFYTPSYCLRYRYRTCHGERGYANVNKATIKPRRVLLAWSQNISIYRPREYNKQLNKGDMCLTKE